MPTMPPITQPQLILPTAAAIPAPITIKIAIGVAIVRPKSTSEFAPVSKGDCCACAAQAQNPIVAAQARLELRTRPCPFILAPLPSPWGTHPSTHITRRWSVFRRKIARNSTLLPKHAPQLRLRLREILLDRMHTQVETGSRLLV